jgi:hypothetical protein
MDVRAGGKYEPFYNTNDETGAPKHPQYSSCEYDPEARRDKSDAGFNSGNLHADRQPADATEHYAFTFGCSAILDVALCHDTGNESNEEYKEGD